MPADHSSPDLINTAPGSSRIPGTLVSAASGGVGGELRYQFALQILPEDRPERDDGEALPRLESSVCGVARSCLSTARVRPLRSSTVTLTLWPKLFAAGQGLGRRLRCQQSAEFLGAADWACVDDAQSVSATRQVKRERVMWIPVVAARVLGMAKSAGHCVRHTRPLMLAEEA